MTRRPGRKARRTQLQRRNETQAAILEASISRESGYIALEYVPGGDLSQYAQPGRLLPQEALVLNLLQLLEEF